MSLAGYGSAFESYKEDTIDQISVEFDLSLGKITSRVILSKIPFIEKEKHIK